jgi:hypothetical protein
LLTVSKERIQTVSKERIHKLKSKLRHFKNDLRNGFGVYTTTTKTSKPTPPPSDSIRAICATSSAFHHRRCNTPDPQHHRRCPFHLPTPRFCCETRPTGRRGASAAASNSELAKSKTKRRAREKKRTATNVLLFLETF